MYLAKERHTAVDKRTMVADTLTQDLIDGGEALLKMLDAEKLRVDAALWFFFPEEGFYKLLLSLPDLEAQGPKAAYEKIQKEIARLGEERLVSLDDVTINKPRSPLLKMLRSAIRTRKGMNSIRFSNNVINGILISDAYIYRL